MQTQLKALNQQAQDLGETANKGATAAYSVVNRLYAKRGSERQGLRRAGPEHHDHRRCPTSGRSAVGNTAERGR